MQIDKPQDKCHLNKTDRQKTPGKYFCLENEDVNLVRILKTMIVAPQ